MNTILLREDKHLIDLIVNPSGQRGTVSQTPFSWTLLMLGIDSIREVVLSCKYTIFF